MAPPAPRRRDHECLPPLPYRRGDGAAGLHLQGHRHAIRHLDRPTGAPILLRGTLWPEHPRSGLLHRSPPIEGTGETRLVLVLDPVDDPEEEV